MDVRDFVTGALDALESDSAKAVLAYAARLLPPDVKLGLSLATSMASPLYMLIDSFINGKIDEKKFREMWSAMLAEGAVADAMVQAAALKREGDQK
jgi:hypothetical protein